MRGRIIQIKEIPDGVEGIELTIVCYRPYYGSREFFESDEKYEEHCQRCDEQREAIAQAHLGSVKIEYIEE